MKFGDTVYVLGNVGEIYEAMFRSYDSESRNPYPYEVDILYEVDESGKPIPPRFVVPKLAKKGEVFVTLTEARNSRERNFLIQVINSYCAEIKTVQDLLAFPLKHDIGSYAPAQFAYRKRARELFGIEIDYTEEADIF